MRKKHIAPILHPPRLLTDREGAEVPFAPTSPQQDLPLGNVAAERARRRETVAEEGNGTAAAWLDKALQQHPKAGAVASELGFTEAYLSEMRHAARNIPLRAVLPLLKHKPSAKALIGEMCAVAGLAPPREKRKCTRRRAHRATAEVVREHLDIWGLLREKIAARAGTDVDDLEAALMFNDADEEQEAAAK